MTFVPRAWSEVVEPLAARFEVAAKFGQSAVWDPEGSEAMAKLMREMARIIDDEIVARATHPASNARQDEGTANV